MKYHLLIIIVLVNYSFQSILPTCNPLNDNDEGKLYHRDVRGKLGPRVVGEIKGYSAESSWEPFTTQSSSSIVGDVFHFSLIYFSILLVFMIMIHCMVLL